MRALALVLLLPISAHAAYSVSISTNYAKTWYSTTGTGLPFGQVRHVNSSLATPPGPYTWYWKLGATFSNDGNGLIPASLGRDCANFVSQCLKAGGVTMSGDVGQNGTFIGAARLGGALRSIATVSTFTAAGGIPSNVGPGDVIIWNQAHATIVSSGQGSGVRLAAHTWDRFDAPLDIYFDHFKAGRSYHITGTNVVAPSDVTAPTMNIFNYQNLLIPNGGWGNGNTFSANVSKSAGEGVAWFEVVTSTPILDREIEPSEGTATYLYTDPTSYGLSHTYSFSLYGLADGTTVYLQAFDGAGNLNLQSFQLDRVSPNSIAVTDTSGNPINSATSSTTVKIAGSDALSGLYTINLTNGGSYNETSTNTTPSPNVSYSDTFPLGGGTLADGSYTATVMDQAGNSTSVNFTINTTQPPLPQPKDPYRQPLPLPLISTNCVAMGQFYSAGVASIKITGPGISPPPMNFPCATAPSNDILSGLVCGLQAGIYTVTVTGCSGTTRSTDYDVKKGTATFKVCLDGDSPPCISTTYNPAGVTASTATITLELPSYPNSDANRVCNVLMSLEPRDSCVYTGTSFKATYTTPCLRHQIIPVRNYSSTETAPGTMTFKVNVPGVGELSRSAGAPGTSATVNGEYNVADNGNLCPQVSTPTAKVAVTLWQNIYNLIITSYAGPAIDLIKKTGRYFAPDTGIAARSSESVFSSTGTINLAVSVPALPAVSTSTAVLFRYDGISWSSAGVTNQQISFNAATSVLSATGTITRTGVYAVLFASPDSSAPATAFSFQGSTSSFDGTLFVSTDAFAVLTATDPVVYGWNSGVATTYYRIDGGVFSVYSSSVPLPLGPHVFQYWSVDWNGNAEAVQTSTFVVTAGTVFKASAGLSAAGKLLAGFLDYGPKADIQSRAQDSYTLLVSSADGSRLLSVTNIGSVSIGSTSTAASLEIGPGPQSALLLRSGNAASTSAVQIAFGYNGDIAASHALTTQHANGISGNSIDLSIWTLANASTATIGGVDALSIQAAMSASSGAVHVLAYGSADVELEVSDGARTGGGVIHRLQAVAPSSRAFKSDIRYLGARDEKQALADVLALKHSRFRYKRPTKDGLVEDKSRPLELGLIYEEAPESIRSNTQAVIGDERLVNAELALKNAIARLEALEARWKKLQDGGK